jgi:hypothetical protein
MRKTHGRILGSLAAVLAAGLAGFSLRPAPRPVTTVASRNPAEVRTQVIRKTIHIVRHQGAGHADRRRNGPGAGGGPTSSARRSVRTGASRSQVAGASGTAIGSAVTTRTSASHAVSAGSAGSAVTASGAPVTTRTSASHGSASTSPAGGSGAAGRPVTTRTSGGTAGGGGEKGDHADHGD